MDPYFIENCKKINGDYSTILILDSGVPINDNLNHNLKKEKTINFSDSNNEIDFFNHQTNISTLISSKLLGLSSKSEIICGKILNNNGTGSIKNILDGLNYANKINPDIINISTGYLKPNIDTNIEDYQIHLEIEKIIKMISKKNILIVCSKKNNIDNFFPADFEHTISIGEKLSNSDIKFKSLNFLVHHSKEDLKIKSGSSCMTAFIAAILSNYISYLKNNKLIIDFNNIKQNLIKHQNNFDKLYPLSILLAEMPINDILKEIEKKK